MCVLLQGSTGGTVGSSADGALLGMDGVHGWHRIWLAVEGPGCLQGGRVASSPGLEVKELGEHGRHGRCLRPMEKLGSNPVLCIWCLLRLTNANVQGVPSALCEPLLRVISGLQRWWLASTRRSGIGGEDQGWGCKFSLFGVFCDVWRGQLYGLYPSCIFVCVRLVSTLYVLFSDSYKYK
ncbi:hypothetical protein VPH35_082603 [Triticum aestivum]